MTRWWTVWALAALLSACGGGGGGGDNGGVADTGVANDTGAAGDVASTTGEDAGPEDTGEPVTSGRFVLASGAEVVVGEDGAVSLRVGERTLASWATAPVESLTYAETWDGPLAIWEFERTNVVATRYDQAREVEASEERVAVGWSRGGDGARVTMAFEAGPTAATTRVTVTVEEAALNAVALDFVCDARSTFHGFGEQYNGLDQRGESFELFVNEQGVGREEGGLRLLLGDAHTTYFPMPWWIDLEGGFGVLVETPYRVLVDLCAADPERARVEVTGGEREVSLLVFQGPSVLELIEQLSEVVGRPKRPPAWAFGAPWISAQGGTEAVRAVMEQLEAHDVPYGAIWSQDWTGERVNADGGLGVQYRWESDPAHYPGLDALVAELHQDGKRFLGYANPFIDPNLPDHFDRMAAEGWLVETPGGEPYVFAAPNIESSHPDLTEEAARGYVERQLSEMVTEYGIDGWMADFGEWTPLDAVFDDGTPGAAAHNLFPVWWHRANRAAMEAARPDGDWVTIARSGWTGVQAYSTVHWVGDQETTWSEDDGIATTIPAMLNLGLAGVPYVTLDIGGFSTLPGQPTTSKELYMRWVELGAFVPIMRTHEGNKRGENWNWNSDEETIAHVRRFARIHVALGPDWAALASEAEATSAPLLRPLFMHYPEDEAARDVTDQFLIGEELLVAPVLEEGAVEREVVLPEGTWYHVFTGEPWTGPMTVTVDAPIGTPPVFSRGVDREDLRAVE